MGMYRGLRLRVTIMGIYIYIVNDFNSQSMDHFGAIPHIHHHLG